MLSRSARLSAVAVVLVVVAGSCATAPSGGGAPPSAQQFCQYYEDVSQDPPAPEEALLVKDEVVAQADETTVSGDSCTDPSAKVDLDGAILAEGEEIPSELGDPQSEPVAAVTGDEIGAGAPVLDNVKVQALSASIGQYGIRLTGNVQLTISGVTSTIGFVGTLQNLNNWSIGLSSSAFTIPGITTSPVVFSGTLSSNYGVVSLTLNANASQVEVGDIKVSNASIHLSASQATGVSASISGTVKVGPSTASGSVASSSTSAVRWFPPRPPLRPSRRLRQPAGRRSTSRATSTWRATRTRRRCPSPVAVSSETSWSTTPTDR